MTGSGQRSLSIIDSHVMLGSDLAIPRDFIEEQAANAHHRLVAFGHQVSRQRVEEQVFSLYQDHDGDRLVAEMDDAGIERAFLVAADFSQVAKCRLTPPELAELHDRVVRRHPGRLGVFWGVDPRAGKEGVEFFERCVREYGFSGMKLYPLNGYSPSDRRLYPYFELCAQHGLPVLSHTGPGWAQLDFTYGVPLLIDQAARDFPQVNFVLGHGGVTHVEEASYLCEHRPNVYLDISQFPNFTSADGWRGHLNRLFRTGINHKILFGTSWPTFRMSASLTAVVKEFVDGTTVFDGVRPSHRKLIMSGNVRRVIGEAAMASDRQVEGER